MRHHGMCRGVLLWALFSLGEINPINVSSQKYTHPFCTIGLLKIGIMLIIQAVNRYKGKL
jgi:hypothetical protein